MYVLNDDLKYIIIYYIYYIPNSISQILNFVMRTPLNGRLTAGLKNGRKNGNSEFWDYVIIRRQNRSAAVKKVLRAEIQILAQSGKRQPHLAAILVGSNGASETYVASKIKSCEETGIKSTLIRLDSEVDEPVLLEAITNLNEDPDVDGILVQLPLPKQIREHKVIEAINPAKDVDGFHSSSAGKLVQGLPTFIPATPYGIMLMLEHFNIETKGKHAVVIGRSNIVGRPMSILLSSNQKQGNCTVTICHSHTQNLKRSVSGRYLVAHWADLNLLKQIW